MYRIVDQDEIIGQRRMLSCGLWAEIVEYKDSRRVRIRFEDGYEVWCKYGNFVAGNVKWYPYCVGKSFYDRYGNDYIVMDQNRGILRTVRLYDGKEEEITVEQFGKLSKRSKYVGMCYESLDGIKYTIIKVYTSKTNGRTKRCDIRFDDGFFCYII